MQLTILLSLVFALLVTEAQCQESDAYLDTTLFDYGTGSGDDYPVNILSIADSGEVLADDDGDRSRRNIGVSPPMSSSGSFGSSASGPVNPWMNMLRSFLAKPSGRRQYIPL